MQSEHLINYLDSAVRLQAAALLHKYAASMIREALSQVNAIRMDEVAPDSHLYNDKQYFSDTEPMKPVAPRMCSVTEMLSEAWKKSLFFSLWGFLPMVFLAKVVTDNTALAFLLAYGMSFVVLLFVIAWIMATWSNTKARVSYEKQTTEYHEKLKAYQEKKQLAEKHQSVTLKRVQDNCRRFNDMLPELQRMASEFGRQLKELLTEVEAKQHTIESFTNAFLREGPLEHVFCHIVATAQLYDYLESGAVTQLSGPYGAYAAYISDSRTHRLECDVDRIMQQLREFEDACKDKQERLYYALLDVSNKEHDLQQLIDAYVSLVTKIMDRFNTLVAFEVGRVLYKSYYDQRPGLLDEILAFHSQPGDMVMPSMEADFKLRLKKAVAESSLDIIKKLQIELNKGVKDILYLVDTYYLLYETEERSRFVELMKNYEC